ncbi:hypothetical protein F4821DRAFT_185075 [Hypoxylon rubiginosum]|uniref:Uncharacterized protein n=1 Tax=Hypoxylon rubiginosum TaxID=110542 RepID=A0ACC0CT99_9PEZI|nr:hypothetical protein F4821DRAFT_185075 [Hypoxylon rubiginosum]
MASNPYEVEHNIKPSTKPAHKRRPDMSSFTSHMHKIAPDDNNAAASASGSRAYLGATPVDLAAMFGMVHDQLAQLRADAPSAENVQFLGRLMEELQADIGAPPDAVPGLSQQYLDGLDRVPSKTLKKDDGCPICAEDFLSDPYPLVVELPCPGRHRYDLECVGPWLLSKGTCPMCRHDLTKKKVVEIPKDDEEEEDDMDGLYG